MDEQERIEIERDVDRLVEALDAERFRHVAGMEPAPSLTSLFQGASRAAHRGSAAALREAPESGGKALGDRVAALRAERVQAEGEEAWRAAEGTAIGHGPAGPIGIVEAERSLAREPDPERRAAFARAAAEGCGAASPAREAAVEARARARAEVGLAPDWEAVVAGDALLSASDDAWRDVVAFSARRELGRDPAGDGGLSRADLLFVLSLGRWSGLFKAGMLPRALGATSGPLRFDLGRVRVDAEARPGKWPGVHAFGARVSFGPRGGGQDWLDLLDGAGRALAASHQPPRLRNPAFGHAVGWLLSSLLLEPRWLSERCDVERRDARELVRALALRRLFALRARAAALRISAEVERGLSGRAWREGYREAMTAALGATWDAVRAARDADGEAHRAALAGAGQGEALRRSMIERFDEDWWRNPRSAGPLAALLAAGGLPEGEQGSPAAAAAALAGLVGGA
jgi:hypothetical protein